MFNPAKATAKSLINNLEKKVDGMKDSEEAKEQLEEAKELLDDDEPAQAVDVLSSMMQEN